MRVPRIFQYRCFLTALFFLISGCASLPDNSDRQASYAFKDTANTSLGDAIATRKKAHQGQDGFRLLGSGLDAFVARAVLAEHAERSIDVQYYLYHQDQVGKLFTGTW
jgi:putative cardiolipin synthase